MHHDILTTMPTSFPDLPLELRDEIYKLIIPVEQGVNGEPLSVNTNTAYGEDYPMPYYMPRVSEEHLDMGSRLLRTCRRVNEEAAPYVYGQQQYSKH